MLSKITGLEPTFDEQETMGSALLSSFVIALATLLVSLALFRCYQDIYFTILLCSL